MKNYALLFGMLSLLLVLTTSCGSESTPANTTPSETTVAPEANAEVDYDKLIQDYCNCCENTVEINQQMERLIDAQSSPEFEKLVPKADKAFKDALNCCKEAKLSQTSGEIDQRKMIKLLKGECPNLPTQLVLKLVTEIK